MERFPRFNFPLLSHLEWHIIGYEEYRLGHNKLIEQGLFSLVFDYHHGFNDLAIQVRWSGSEWSSGKFKPWPPNRWHMAGCDEAFEYWFNLPDADKLQPMQDYVSSPVIEGYNAQLRGWTKDPDDICAWCRRSFVRGYHVWDYLQEHVFCSREHAILHRRKIAEAPIVQGIYQQYQFRPLPADPRKIRQYLESLPDIQSDAVIIRPITLPPVEMGRPERISSGNQEGNQHGNQEPPKGFTAEDD